MRSRRITMCTCGRALVVLLALSALQVAACHAHTEHELETRRHVVVDTDMGLDDVRAVFALLADSTLHIEAFVTVEGSAALGKGTDNLIGLLEASRSNSIPVIMGSRRAGLDAPPWRQTANSLGGAVFPPPRNSEAMQFTPGSLGALAENNPGLQYLALGPLSNLMALAIGDPHGFGHIETVYIPSVLAEGALSGFNLTFDIEASEMVLTSAPRVVIIDISGAEGLDGIDFLSSLEGESSPVLYMEQLVGSLGDRSPHVMLYDEMAAIGFLRDELLGFDSRTYEAEKTDTGTFVLTPSSSGNISVARLVDTEGALNALRRLYAYGPVQRHAPSLAPEVPAETLLRAFHGHLGPYVVIGYRMARLALSELGSEGHFGVSAQVHSPLETPRSCLIDGVQIGSGCTLGKGNIMVAKAPEPAWARFAGAGGDEVTVRLRRDIPALVRELVNSEGVEAAGRAFFQMRLDSLFTVERPAR
ncbi:MAG: nucleoside hydrolase [bacterium]